MGISLFRAKGRRFASVLLGAALLWGWEYESFLSMFLVPDDAAFAAPLKMMRFSFLAASSVTAFMLWLVLRKRGRSFQPTMAAASLFMLAVVTIIVGCAERNGSLFALCMVGVLLGIFFAFATIAWCSRLSMEGDGCIPALLASFALSFLLYLIAYLFPQAVRVTVVVAMPFISGVIWWVDYRSRRNEAGPKSDLEIVDIRQELFLGDSGLGQISWRTLLALGTIVLFGEAMVAFVLADEKPALDALSLVCASLSIPLLVFAFVRSFRSTGESQTATLCCIAAPVAVLGLLAFMTAGQSSNSIVGGILQCASCVSQVAVFVFLSDIGREKGLSPILSFGVGMATLRLVMLVGDVLGDAVHCVIGLSGLPMSSVPAVAIFAICVMLAAFVSRRVGAIGSEDIVRNVAGVGEVQDAGMVLAAREVAIEDFAASYHLSPRETEVLGHLLSGRSAPAIAEKMVITTGTVKTHLVHIYKKMDVNGRQDIVDRFEAMLGREN